MKRFTPSKNDLASAHPMRACVERLKKRKSVRRARKRRDIGLPQEFYDVTSRLLLAQPQPQYLFVRLALEA